MENKVVVAFAFADNPGALSNQRIQRRAREVAEECGTRALTQPELLSQHCEWFEIVDPPGLRPAPTLRLARAMVRHACENGCNSIVVVAAPPHQRRCKRDFSIAVAESGASMSIEFDQTLHQFPVSTWFCTDAGQLHTRFRAWWIVRELILRILPQRVYTRVVS